MSTNLTISVNCDTQDQPYNASGVDWRDMNLISDKLIFSNGSPTVIDEATPIPSSADYTQAGVVVGGSAFVVPKYFLSDNSANTLYEIHNAGDNNKRYVFCFSFDGATGSEPILEVWDDEDLDTIDSFSLGEGVANDSWIWGKVTTDALPGSGWLGTTPSVGIKLAGSVDNHFLWLNNGGGTGALGSGGKNLYCQLKIIVPSSEDSSASESPTFVIKFTTN